MEIKRQRRITLTAIAVSVLVIVSGITYLAMRSDTTDSPVSDGFDAYRAPLKEAKQAYDNGEALFIDVRDEASYQQAHIPNAVLIPLTDLPDNVPDINRDALIYTYCT